MKRKSPARSSALNFIPILLSLLAPSLASATTELDRLYSLDTIGHLRSWDNVDGLFADYVSAAYRDYFTNQSRFVLHDLSKADDLLTRAKLPYNRVIEDKEILAQLARSTRTQSLIRTKITKEGPKYRFLLEWLHTPKMDVMASESFHLDEPQDGQSFGLGNIKGELQKGLDRMIAKVPFVGHVTGRDEGSVTINLGASANLKPGDTIAVATLDQVKKHPLLAEIVEWRLTPTGRLVVESVDEKLTFAKITEEEEGKRIARFQKVTQILPKPVALEPKIVDDKQQRLEDFNQTPSLGYVKLGTGFGSFSREFAPGGAVATQELSELSTNVSAEAQIWLNRNWFAETAFGFGFFSSGSYTQFKLATGYTYLVTPEFFGPKAWVKLGYRSTSYHLTETAALLLAPVGFGSLFIGIGADLPIRDQWGVTANVDFGVLSSASETFASGVRSGSEVADVSFFVGGYYRLNPRTTIRAGIDVMSHSASFLTSGTHPGGGLSQKNITFAPSLLYYF